MLPCLVPRYTKYAPIYIYTCVGISICTHTSKLFELFFSIKLYIQELKKKNSKSSSITQLHRFILPWTSRFVSGFAE